MVLNIKTDVLFVCELAPFKLSWFRIIPSIYHEERDNTRHQERVLNQICSEGFLPSCHHVEQPGERTELLDILNHLWILLSVIVQFLNCLLEFIVKRDQEADLFENIVEVVRELLVFQGHLLQEVLQHYEEKIHLIIFEEHVQRQSDTPDPLPLSHSESTLTS